MWTSSLHAPPRLRVIPGIPRTRMVWSPQLGIHKPIRLWLPPSLGTLGRRYPVIYAQDGERVLASAFEGRSWHAPETLQTLAAQDIEAILVGIESNPNNRNGEYSPFVDAQHGGGDGQRYVAFLADTLKPLIDDELPSRPEPESSVLLGSSLGALIGLCAFLDRPRQLRAARGSAHSREA
jgi:alpha-glucosidase